MGLLLWAKTNPTRNDDLTIDDPAVERVAVELIELFPNPQSHGQKLMAKDWSGKNDIIGGFNTRRGDDPSVVVRAGNANDTAGFVPTGDGSYTILLVPGGVYEVRFYGAVPESKQQLSDTVKPAGQRFGKGVWHGLRKFTAPGGTNYRLGVPLVLTFEVSTSDMPVLNDGSAEPDTPLAIDRLIAQTGDKAEVMLRQEFVINNYPAARYVNRVSLLSQRWGWRGRPAGTIPPLTEFPAKPAPAKRSPPAKSADQSQRLADGDIKDFESIAFVDRRDDDIGVIDEMKLHLSHLMPGVDSGGNLKPADSDGRPALLRKDLLYKGGANWWRFGLSATSRYAAMKQARSDLIAYSHINPSKPTADWDTLIVRDRDTGRIPKRPGLMLVLPLTETVMSDGVIPPLLAIFSEPMFPGFHIGDGVEATLDYARYPLENDGTQRFWPQYGPDPILTKAGHSGTPVPIRVDGPLGYTFDVGTEAPKFGRSGYLVTPVSGADKTDIRPWSFARLRFRRLESIELSLYAAYPIASDRTPANLLLTSAGVTLPPDAIVMPREFHEGLVLDFAQLTTQQTGATISMANDGSWPSATASVTATLTTGQLKLDLQTSLGGAGTYALDLRPASRVWLRVVLSQREKPQDGNKL
jgi:hypothetical protein